MIGSGLTATAFDYTPRFTEYYQIPTITARHNESNGVDEILQFVWPLECNITDITSDHCQDSEILENKNFWLNLSAFTNCDNDQMPITIFETPTFESRKTV